MNRARLRWALILMTSLLLAPAAAASAQPPAPAATPAPTTTQESLCSGANCQVQSDLGGDVTGSISTSGSGVSATVPVSTSGSPGGGTGGTGGAVGTPRVCSVYSGRSTGAEVVDCEGPDGWFNQDQYCYYMPADTPADNGGMTGGAWYTQRCYNYTGTGAPTLLPGALTWRATAPAEIPATYTARDVALLASGTMHLPAPVVHRLPDLTAQDHGATVVNAVTWYWADPTSIAPQTTGQITLLGTTLALKATATLTLDFGDHTKTVTCTDGGTAPRPGQVNNREHSPSGCEHIFTRSTAYETNHSFPAVYTTTWDISYSTDNATTWTDLRTQTQTTTDPTPVIEIQILNIPAPTP